MNGSPRRVVLTASLAAVSIFSGSEAIGGEPSIEAAWEWLLGPVASGVNFPRGAAICFSVIVSLSTLWLLVEVRNARRSRRECASSNDPATRGAAGGRTDPSERTARPRAEVARAQDLPDAVELKRSSESRVASTNVIPGVVEDDAGQTQVIAASGIELETSGFVGTEALGTAGLLAGLANDGGAFTRPVSDLPGDAGSPAPSPPSSATADGDGAADEFECTQVLSAPEPAEHEKEFECTQVLSAPDDDLECTQVLLSPLGKSGSPEDSGGDGELVGELEELMGKKLG